MKQKQYTPKFTGNRRIISLYAQKTLKNSNQEIEKQVRVNGIEQDKYNEDKTRIFRYPA